MSTEPDWITYRIEIPGKPIAKKRPRFFRRGSFVGTYNAQETEEGRFMLMARDALGKAGYPDVAPAGTPVWLEADFWFEYPKATPKKRRCVGFRHTKKPDVDNLLKFLKDCLNGLAWHDDNQVFSVRARKLYGEQNRTVVWIIRPPAECSVCQRPELMEAF